MRRRRGLKVGHGAGVEGCRGRGHDSGRQTGSYYGLLHNKLGGSEGYDAPLQDPAQDP